MPDHPDRVAIVAHHDASSVIDPTFVDLVRAIRQVCDRVIVVSTCDVRGGQGELPDGVELKCRPNVGYDFVSYRVGLSSIPPDRLPRVVLLANSTVLVLRTERFVETLRSMARAAERHGVSGITSSRQGGWHLQSFLLAFGRSALRSSAFHRFFAEVRPLNTKDEVIRRHEIGLSRDLRLGGLALRSCSRLSSLERGVSSLRWLKDLEGDEASGGRLRKVLRRLRVINQGNPAHFAADALARRHGFCKAELALWNPKGIDLGRVYRSADPDAIGRIEAFRRRSRAEFDARARRALVAELDPARVLRWGRSAPPPRVAVVAHVFHPELLEELLACVRAVVEPCHVLVTTPFEADATAYLDAAARTAAEVTVAITPNLGRDVGPFLALVRAGMLDSHDVVLKIHSKRSSYSTRGDEWRRQLLHDVAGSSLHVRRILSLFEDPRVGMVGPLRFFLSNPRFWGGNRERTQAILASACPDHAEMTMELGFFAGSMFWCRPEAIRRLGRIPPEALAFEPESGQQDGTAAHAIERAFAQVARLSGYRVTALELSGSDIFEHRCMKRDVPVLA